MELKLLQAAPQYKPWLHCCIVGQQPLLKTQRSIVQHSLKNQ